MSCRSPSRNLHRRNRRRGSRARGATAFETKVPESARTGRGGGRGRVARRAVQPKESRAAGEKAGERGRPAGAVAGRTGRGKGPRDEPLSTGYARDQDMAKKDGSLPTLAKEELGELGISMLDARCPRVADVARPISEMMKQRADAPPAAGRRGMGRGFIEEGVVADSPAAGAFVLEQARELGDHLDDVHATMLDTVRRSGLAPRAEPARADRGAVTLRVTVLPPPQTTQPVSATSSPEAP